MNIICDICGSQLTEQGALLVSPPIDKTCTKIHICVDCFKKMLDNFTLRTCQNCGTILCFSDYAEDCITNGRKDWKLK